MRSGVAVLAVCAKIVPHFESVFAKDFGERRLYRIDVVRPDIATAVAQRSERGIGVITVVVIDPKTRQVAGVSEESR